MQRRNFRSARMLAATLGIAILATTGAACSSSSAKAASKPSASSTAPNGQAGATTTAAQSSGTGSGGPNPCTLVTAAEVTTILGTSAAPAGPTSENRGTVCHWRPAGGGSLLVMVFHGKEFYDPAMQAPKAKKITGLGDDAYFDDFGTTRAGVGFLKGDVAVFLDGVDISSSAAVLAAARDAVTKI